MPSRALPTLLGTLALAIALALLLGPWAGDEEGDAARSTRDDRGPPGMPGGPTLEGLERAGPRAPAQVEAPPSRPP